MFLYSPSYANLQNWLVSSTCLSKSKENRECSIMLSFYTNYTKTKNVRYNEVRPEVSNNTVNRKEYLAQ